MPLVFLLKGTFKLLSTIINQVQSQQNQLCCVYIIIYVSCNKDLKQKFSHQSEQERKIEHDKLVLDSKEKSESENHSMEVPKKKVNVFLLVIFLDMSEISKRQQHD